MAENSRPPVAIRIVRPYLTEEEFLDGELETVGKTSVILIGAHSRPSGVILRFEVTLASGVTILRGEGRVLGYKENAFRGQAGLGLRFTRLDPKSKALVDRAAAIRDARLSDVGPVGSPSTSHPVAAPAAPSEPPPRMAPPRPASRRPPSVRPDSVKPDASLAEALTAPTPSPAPVESLDLAQTSDDLERELAEPIPDLPPSTPDLPSSSPQLEPDTFQGLSAADLADIGASLEAEMSAEPADESAMAAVHAAMAEEQLANEAPEPAPAPSNEHEDTHVETKATPPESHVPAHVVPSPRPGRDALLARLRERAAALPPERIQELLGSL